MWIVSRWVIRLELYLKDDSPTGRATHGDGAGREFVGWMGLVAAIDALARGSTRAAAANSPRAGERGAAS
jgi:hypothetical protein